jgi:RsiW-degrading membrane proteinase PrsW (M82 family)
MNTLALAAAAIAFPCVLMLCSVAVVLRKRRLSVSFNDVAAFLGLGLLTIVFGEIWSLVADRWLLGRVNLGFYYAFLTAAIPEEGFRFLIILYGLRRRPHIGLVSAMLLGSLVGLTFATYEHVLYAVSSGWETWLARSFTSVPYHALSGTILGYAAAALLRTRKAGNLVWFAVLVVAHGLADWPLDDPTRKEPESVVETFIVSGWAGNVALLIVAIVLAIALTRKAMRSEVGDTSSRRPIQ